MNVSTVGQSYKNILIVFTAICMFTQCIAELFTAVTDMEEMLDTETVLIDNLETYVRLQEHQLSFLRRYAYTITIWMSIYARLD